MLKNSIGKEIVLQHIYSEEVHIGILKELNPDFVTLDTGKREKKLKIANIRILDENALLNWKLNNESIKINSISCIFPENSNENVIENTIKNSIEDIIEVKITDIYTEHQIPKILLA